MSSYAYLLEITHYLTTMNVEMGKRGVGWGEKVPQGKQAVEVSP